jgi:hypothetical protein
VRTANFKKQRLSFNTHDFGYANKNFLSPQTHDLRGNRQAFFGPDKPQNLDPVSAVFNLKKRKKENFP